MDLLACMYRAGASRDGLDVVIARPVGYLFDEFWERRGPHLGESQTIVREPTYRDLPQKLLLLLLWRLENERSEYSLKMW